MRLLSYLYLQLYTVFQEEFIPKDSKYNRYVSAQIMLMKKFSYGLFLAKRVKLWRFCIMQRKTTTVIEQKGSIEDERIKYVVVCLRDYSRFHGWLIIIQVEHFLTHFPLIGYHQAYLGKASKIIKVLVQLCCIYDEIKFAVLKIEYEFKSFSLNR